jgi:hypothetical protein
MHLPSASVVSTKVLPLANAGFESGSQVPALGVPAAAGEWSGDYSRVVTAESGITPKKGQQMLRFLRSDNELSSKNERSYVGDVVQVIDLRSLRAEMSGAEQMVELSAWFNSISTPGVRYEFAVKAATFRGDISDAPRLWLDRDASASRSNHFVVADSESRDLAARSGAADGAAGCRLHRHQLRGGLQGDRRCRAQRSFRGTIWTMSRCGLIAALELWPTFMMQTDNLAGSMQPKPLFYILFIVSLAVPAWSAPPLMQSFLDANCMDCHDSEMRKGGLNLDDLAYQPTQRGNASEVGAGF